MAEVIWTEPALDDLRAITKHVAADSPVYAERLALRLVEAPRRLEAFPLSGRVVPEFAREDIREVIHGAYRIIYTIRADACYVVAVMHGSREILRHLDPGEWVVE